jgi:putative ABC transport system permease protein
MRNPPHLWFIRLIGVIVPQRLRADWRQEWEAELHWREQQLAAWDKLTLKNKLDLWWHSAGAFLDALWLQPKRWEDEMIQDIRFAVRMLCKHKSLTAIVVLTLGLGIGANTAMFSVVNGVLLRPLPYPHADRLVALSQTSQTGDRIQMAWPNFVDLQAQQTSFAELAAAVPVGMILTGAGEPQRFIGKWVTANFFATLEVQPQLGRLFTAAEDQRDCERVIVVTHGFWQQRLGGRADIIGQTVTLNAEPWTVVGVLRPEFEFYGPDSSTIFYPMGRLLTQEYMHQRTSHPLLWLVARLQPQVTLPQAQVEMTQLSARLAQQYPEANAGKSILVLSFYDDYVGDLQTALQMLLGAVGLVLLIACANVANLLLACGATRRKELALRMALGAGRARIVRQLLTESLLLAVAGATVGLLLAKLGLAALLALDPEQLPRLYEVQLDGRALWFTLVVTCGAGLLFGLAPAWQSSRTDLQETLKEGGRNAVGVGQRVRQTLVVTEIALSLLLLIGAGLLLRSFQSLLAVDPGFDLQQVLTMRLRLPDAKYVTSAQTLTFLQQTEARVVALPGVLSVSFSNGVPLGGSDINSYQLEGQPDTMTTNPVAISRSVSPNYHQTLGIRLLAGRSFTTQDSVNAPLVVLVDEGFVRRHWPDQSLAAALGQRVKLKGEAEWREIVGVVRRVKQYGLDAVERTEIYRPLLQIPVHSLADLTRSMDLVVKSAADPYALIQPIKQAIQAIDRDQPIANVHTMDEYLAMRTATRRFNLYLLSGFALLALVLGAIGIYGVMSYTVAQRTSEIGVRMALGAQVRDVWKLILGQGLKLALLGIALGLGGAFFLTRWLRALLFGVSARDPLTFLVLPLVLLLVSLLACYWPARRATKVDPMIALRHD